MVTFGSGDYKYGVVENFFKRPKGWPFVEVADVAVDKDDNVYDSMAGDIYGQGKVLALTKYKYLKWSYTSFLWGMSSAILVFITQQVI